jgi:hypothetical protein
LPGFSRDETYFDFGKRPSVRIRFSTVLRRGSGAQITKLADHAILKLMIRPSAIFEI